MIWVCLYQRRPQAQSNHRAAAMDKELQKLTKLGSLSSGAPAAHLNLHTHIGQHLVFKGKYLISGTLELAVLLLTHVTRYRKLERQTL